MDTNEKNSELKMTYIGQASLEGSGTGGTARVKTMTDIFKGLGIKINFISYSFYSDKFKIEHKKIDQLLHMTTIHVPNSLPKFLKVFAIFPVFIYAWKSCKNSDIIFADFIAVVTSLPAIMLRKIFNKPVILDYIDVSSRGVMELAEKINYMLSDDNLRANLSHNAAKNAQKYSWERTTDKFVTIYQELVEGKDK